MVEENSVYQLFLLLHSRSFLISLTLFFCFSSVLIFISIVVVKLRLERRESHRQQKEKSYLGHCMRYLREQEHRVPVPTTEEDWHTMADVLINLLRGSVASKRQEQLKELVRQLQVSLQIAPSLFSKSWIRRLNGVERLGFLLLPENIPLLKEALETERDPHVRAKLLWALSLVGGLEEALLLVSKLMQQEFISSKFNEHLYRNLIEHLHAQGRTAEAFSLCEQLIVSEQVPVVFKRDLIGACGVVGFSPAVPLIQQFYERSSTDPASTISCLRALGEMAADPEGDLILPSLRHPDWRIRAVAARAAATVKGGSKHLGLLLGDAHYHVRMNAAMALARQGESGRAELERGLTNQDKFIRDICRYMNEAF